MKQDHGKLKQELRQFYKTNLPETSVISQLNHRHFRLALPSGRFMKLQDRIRDPKTLQDWLVRLTPFHVYYTTSSWLDPVALKPRPKKNGKKFRESGIILSNDVAFDIDREPLLKRNLESARLDTLRLRDLMREKGYTFKYGAFSGSKGFHLFYHDHEAPELADPYEREMALLESRKNLVKEVVEEHGIDIDQGVTKDTRRIMRVPGTVNIRTGYVCTILSEKELEQELDEILAGAKKLPSTKPIPSFRLPKLPKLPDLSGLFKKQQKKGKKKDKAEQAPRATRLCYTTYLQSNVLGTKGRHAAILALEGSSVKRVEAKLKKLINDFSLTDVYLFKAPGRFVAISLRTFQRNRYQKILDAAGAENAKQLRKYNVASVRVGGLVGQDMEELEPHMVFVKTIPAPEENSQRFPVSTGHLAFVQRHGIETTDYPQQHGSGEFKLIDAVLKL